MRMDDIERIRKMARKTRKVVTESVLEEKPDNGAMGLTELEMAHLMVHEQRVEMNKLQGEKFAFQEQLLNIEYAKNRDLLRKRQGECMASMERARTDYNAVREQVQVRLGVNLDGYTVNEAGQLTAIPQSGN